MRRFDVTMEDADTMQELSSWSGSALDEGHAADLAREQTPGNWVVVDVQEIDAEESDEQEKEA